MSYVSKSGPWPRALGAKKGTIVPLYSSRRELELRDFFLHAALVTAHRDSDAVQKSPLYSNYGPVWVPRAQLTALWPPSEVWQLDSCIMTAGFPT